jgi:hypothetical protein
MAHVGVDLDKRSSQIAVVTEDGEIVQQRLTNDAAGLEKFFAKFPPQPIAVEGLRYLVVARRSPRASGPSPSALESKAEESHRGRPP